MSQESIYIPGETYTSIRATPELVGRKDVLEQITRAIQDTSQSYIIYITGQGGIGKTRLVKHVLKNPPKEISLVAAADLVDLYHTSNQTPEGLVDAIQRALSSDGGQFKRYLAACNEFNEHLTRYGSAPERQRREMLAAFMSDLNELAEHKRILLSLDTAEKLFFQRDPAADRLGLAEEHPAVLDWLLGEFLPNINNAVILLSGRRGEAGLDQALSKVPGKRTLSIDLKGLTESEALDYFEAVVRSGLVSGDPRDAQIADAIRRWSDEDRQAIFYCLCDEGDPPTIRPILLALAIDHLAVAGRPLSALTRPLSEARMLTPAEREAIRDELGRSLVEVLHENRRPADEVIRALGWLRKGADAELLVRVAELESAEVEKALNDIRDLSFVKIRPADNRVFLHDEMYALLERFALERASDAERERVFEAIQGYYDERIKQARNEIPELYRPLAEPALPEPAQVAAARARLQDALVEDLHYRLRWNAADGFQTYFCYAEEAIIANNASLDMQLRAELLDFLSARDPSGTAVEIDGLRRADVVADAAVRWVKRLTERERYEDALQVVESLRREARDLVEAGGDLARLELDVREAQVLSRLGQFERAEQLLANAISTLESKPRSLRQTGILARAYNNLGYLHRLLGRHHGAISAYQKALPLWRATKIEVEQANTLNNLAFAKAEVGEFDAAWRQARDALLLREKMGPREPVGLGLNTLAHIKIRDDNLEEARMYAERARGLFDALQSERGKGLALVALAEAERRISDRDPYFPHETAQWLQKAIEHSKAASAIFEKLNEPARWIEALIEEGCACRDLAKFRHDQDGAHAVGAIASDAQQALEKAADLAEKYNIRYRQVDALVNLAWLYHYVFQNEKAIAVLDQVTELVSPDHRITLCEKGMGGIPSLDKERAVVPFLVQLGKAELLRGQIAFNRFQESGNKDEEALREAARCYTLSLAYDALFSDQVFRDMRRGMDRIYERLKLLNVSEMRIVCDTVEETEKKYGLGESRMRRFLEENFGPWESFVAAGL